MKNKKILFLFVAVIVLCLSTALFAACNKNDTPPSSNGDFKEGDVIVDKNENTVTEKEYDEAGREVREISHVETLYNVTYLANDASVIYLKGNKSDEMYVSGYDGVPKTLSVKDLESKISLDGNAIVVKGITEEAFMGCETLTSVDLEKEKTNTLTFAIGDQAFANCPNLATVTLPTKVYMKSGSIGDGAFYNCESLTKVVIPDRFKTLGKYAFANCLKLETVTFNEGVAKVPQGFLYGCESLTSVTIPSTVNYVGNEAFSGCKKLTTITFPDSVTYVGSEALADCIALQSVKIPFIGNSYSPMSNSTFGNLFGTEDVVNPDTEESYLYESSYTGRFIPKTLTSVEVTNATSLPAYAFAGIESLTSLSVTYTTAGRIRVYAADTDYYNYDVPQITAVGAYAFAGLNKISEFPLPEKATTIGECAFTATGLTDAALVGILMKTQTIDDGAFSDLPNVTSVAIPQNVLSVGMNAFARNANLKSFLSTAKTALSRSILKDCRSLETVTVPYIGTSYVDVDANDQNFVAPYGNAFANIFSTDYPSDLYDEDDFRLEENYYQAYEYYVPNTLDTITVTSATEIPTNAFREILARNISISLNSDMLSDPDFDGVTIEPSAFNGCKNLTSFALDSNYKDISSSAFKNSGLESVTIPSSVRRIADNAFANCENLTTFTVNGKNTAIYNAVLANCRSLASVTVPYIGTAFWTTDTYNGDEYLSYANNAFANIFSYSYPEDMYSDTDTFRDSPRYYGVDTGGSGTYYVPTSLTTVNVTNAQAIPYSAFRGILASSITVTYDEDADLTASERTSIGAYAFYGCENLTSFTIDSHITNINNYAFANSGLTSVTIPESVTYVSSTAFENCSDLDSLTWNAAGASVPDFSKSNITTLTLGEEVLDIPSNAFSNMSSLTTINVNATALNSIGSGAFSGTPWLTSQTGAVYLGKILFKYIGTIPANSTGELSFAVNAGTVAIENYALQNQSNIEDIYIPASVTRIGAYAFTGCSNLSVVLYGGTQEQYDEIIKATSGILDKDVIFSYVNDGTHVYQFSSDGTPLSEYEQTTNYLRTLPTPTARTDYVFYGWYENEDFSGEPVSAPYWSRNGATLYARWLTQEEYNELMDGSSFEKAIIVRSNQTYDVNITTGGQRVYFRFVPPTSGSYSITASNSSGDNYGYLYDSSRKELTHDDDGAGNNSNFKITWSLVAGQTYYIAAKMYSSSTTGSFKITITMN